MTVNQSEWCRDRQCVDFKAAQIFSDTVVLTGSGSASTRLKAHTGILTILRRDSSPVSLPVWYVVDEHTIVMRTPPPTKKVGHIKRDARAAFLVEPGER